MKLEKLKKNWLLDARKSILILVMINLLVSTLIMETYGRTEEKANLLEEFSNLKISIKKLERYKDPSSGAFTIEDILVNNLSSRKDVKFIALYRDEHPWRVIQLQPVYVQGDYWKRTNIYGSPSVDVNMSHVSLEGYIGIKPISSEDISGVYIVMEKVRYHTLWSWPQILTLALNALLLAGSVWSISYYQYRKLASPWQDVTQYCRAVVNSQQTKDFTTDVPEVSELVTIINAIKHKMKVLQSEADIERIHLTKGQRDSIICLADIILKNLHSLNEAANPAARYLCNNLDKVISCSIWFVKNNELLNMSTFYNVANYSTLSDFPADKLYPVEEMFTRTILDAGSAVLIDDFQDYPQFNSCQNAYPFSLLGTPIIVDDKIVGVVDLWKVRIPYTSVFDKNTVEFVEIFSMLIGLIYKRQNE